MTRKKANSTCAEPLLKKGIAAAKKLQEMEEHTYACGILPGAAKALRKAEELGILPEDYYMSGLLEWLEDQDSGFTYEEYEKLECARRPVDWKGYLLNSWSGAKRGGVAAFIEIAKWKLEQYEYFGHKLFDAIGWLSKNIDADKFDVIATTIFNILSVLYVVRVLYGLNPKTCGEYIEQHAKAALKDIPRIRLIQKFVDENKKASAKSAGPKRKRRRSNVKVGGAIP